MREEAAEERPRPDLQQDQEHKPELPLWGKEASFQLPPPPFIEHCLWTRRAYNFPGEGFLSQDQFSGKGSAVRCCWPTLTVPGLVLTAVSATRQGIHQAGVCYRCLMLLTKLGLSWFL